MGSSGGNRGPSSYFNKNAPGSKGGLPNLGSSGGIGPGMGSFNKNSAIGGNRPMGSGSNYYGPVGGIPKLGSM